MEEAAELARRCLGTRLRKSPARHTFTRSQPTHAAQWKTWKSYLDPNGPKFRHRPKLAVS
jgi:hypothetical protein